MSEAPIWAVAEVRLGKMLQPAPLETGEVEVAYVKSGHLSKWADLGVLPSMWASAADLRRYELRPGDLMVAEGGDLAASCFVPDSFGPAIFQNSLHRVRLTREGDIRFLRYALEALRATGTVDAMCDKATFGHYTLEKIKQTRVPWPAPEHQRSVAEFLDDECGRIDALDSQLGAAANGAAEPVLRVLCDELASCPIVRIGYRFEVQLGKMLDASSIDADDTLPYLRNANIYWDRVDLRDVKEMSFSPDDRRRYRVRPGDLLVCEGRHVGRSAVWEGQLPEAYFQKALHRVRSRSGDSTRFLMWCLRLMHDRGDFYADGTGSTIPHLPAERLRAAKVPLPSLGEQRRILGRMDRAARLSAELEGQARSMRMLLTEYRGALITEVVTGKFDITSVSDRQLEESAHAAMEGEQAEVLSS